MKYLERANKYELQEMLDKLALYRKNELEAQQDRIKSEIAIKLKHRNFNDDFIVDVLDFEIEKIEKLKVSRLLQMLYEELGDVMMR